MARTINAQEYAQKRNDILDAALRLVYSNGFARMTIQDILAELEISSGAFYHYFDSKPALLQGIVERMQQEIEPALRSIIDNPHLTTLEKLRRFFATFDRLRLNHRMEVIELLRVWYIDDNAVVRQKVDEAVAELRAPLLTAIIRQGLQEGVLTTAYPDQAAEIVLSIVDGMSNRHARLLLAWQQERDDRRCTDAIVATHSAYMAAMEQVLGAPAGCLVRTDADAVQVWLAAMRARDDRKEQHDGKTNGR